MGATSRGAVSSVARGDGPYKTAFGYQWKYEKYNKIEPYVNNSAKSKIKSVFVFDIFNNKHLNFESIADAVRTLSKSKNFDSDCATMSSCCKSGTIFQNKYLCSYTNLFKVCNRKTIIYNPFQDKFYSNAKIAAEENNLSEWTVKHRCIDQNNVEWVYVIDSARTKLSESGKLLI